MHWTAHAREVPCTVAEQRARMCMMLHGTLGPCEAAEICMFAAAGYSRPQRAVICAARQPAHTSCDDTPASGNYSLLN